MSNVVTFENITECAEHENIAKVAYAFGLLESELGQSVTGEVANDMDWEDIYVLSKMIHNDWSNFVDIKNNDEEGYIIPYAIRKWNDYFSIK